VITYDRLVPGTLIERGIFVLGLIAVAGLGTLTALSWRDYSREKEEAGGSQEATRPASVLIANSQGQPRPISAPRIVPAWASQLRRWWLNRREGPRPANAPLPAPAWFWEWNAWKSGVTLRPDVPAAARSDKLVSSAPIQARRNRVEVVLTAARGDSWLEVRLGSGTGPVRYTGTLVRGRTLRVSGRQLWIRTGIADNLVALLNGRPAQELPRGAATLLATPKGLRTLALG
jgi:hypothetical protein